MNHDSYPDNYIRGILNGVKSIAMVGASPVNVRPSYFAFKYLAQRGYDMIPVNPGHVGKELLGKPFVASLSDIGRPIDMIDIFRNSSHIMPVVEEALTLDPAADGDLDAAWRTRRCGGTEGGIGRYQGGDEPLPQDRIWPSVLGDLLDGRQFAHAEFQAPPGADAGYALIPQSDECRRRRDRGIGSRRQKQDRAKLTQLRRVHFANATMRSTIILM
ncbi:putative CoA-binding protein [Bradyrhizobium sp. LM6.10]